MPILMTLADFNNFYGANPYSGLVADSAGDLFGTTTYGGAFGGGTVFEIAKSAGGYSHVQTLVSFDGSDGANPYSSLTVDAGGNLFGTTSGGGANRYGTVFEIAKTATGYASMPTTLVNFNGSDGAHPTFGGLTADAAGDLFGTTQAGGANNAGTVFEIAKTDTGYASTPTTLVNFNGSNGASPESHLIADAAGNLFGTTTGGGANGLGTVFEIAKTAAGYTSMPTTLVSLNGSDGQFPTGGLTMDSAGNLFGTASAGGANGYGTVFEIARTATGYASTLTTLVSFTGSNGANPYGGVILDAAGNLYGTTSGTVFEIAKTGSGYASTPTTLFDFNGSDGAIPAYGSLIADAAGSLFGTTSIGGTLGTAFQLTLTATISGTAQEGQLLAASADGIVADYQWQELIGSTWTDISGATASTYRVQEADEGHQIRVQLAGGSLTSAPTSAVLDAAPTVTMPVVTGVAQQGQRLTASATAGQADNLVSYQWVESSDGGASFHNIAGATGSVYNLQSTDVGSLIEVVATATNDNGVTASAASTPTVAVDDAPPFLALTGIAAENSSTATLTGTIDLADAEGIISLHSGSALIATATADASGNWSFGGVPLAITNSSFTVQASDASGDTGSSQYVFNALSEAGVTLSPGSYQYVYGSVNSLTIGAGAEQDVYGSADNTTIGNAGFQHVFGIVTGTTINDGGEQNIYAPGTADGTTLNVGGSQVDWGAASNTVVDGGDQFVWGTATNTTISSGVQYVESGGATSATTINGSGEQDVYGSADNTIVGNGGFQHVFGIATHTTIDSGGEQNIYVAGSATGTTLNLDGTQVDWGTANNTTIDAGKQFVVGTANNTTILWSGVQYIESGGTSNGITIDAGGTEHVFGGGTAQNVTFGGPNATLALDQSSAVLNGAISGFQAGDTIDLGDIVFMNYGGTHASFSFSENSDNSGGTLTVSDGTHVATIALLGQYTTSSFALSYYGEFGTTVTDTAIASPQPAVAAPQAVAAKENSQSVVAASSNDTFVFKPAATPQSNTVAGYHVGDKLDLSAFAALVPGGNLHFDAIASQLDHTAGQIIAIADKAGTGTMIDIDTTGSGHAAIDIHLQNFAHSHITGADFLI